MTTCAFPYNRHRALHKYGVSDPELLMFESYRQACDVGGNPALTPAEFYAPVFPCSWRELRAQSRRPSWSMVRGLSITCDVWPGEEEAFSGALVEIRPALESLELQHLGLWDPCNRRVEEVHALIWDTLAALTLPSLQSLSMSEIDLDNSSEAAIDNLSFGNLSVLELEHVSIAGGLLARLAAKVCNESGGLVLHFVDASNESICRAVECVADLRMALSGADAKLSLLREPSVTERLSSLAWSSARAVPSDIDRILAGLRQLRELRLLGGLRSTTIRELLRKQDGLENIRVLELSNTAIDAESAHALRRWNTPSLETLVLNETSLSDPSLDLICAHPSRSNVTGLSLSHNELSGVAGRILANAPFAGTLEFLDVSGNTPGLGDEGMRFMCSDPVAFRSLKELNVSHSGICTLSGEQLVAACPSLQEVDLSLNDLAGSGDEIAPVVECSGLRVARLGSCGLTDEDVCKAFGYLTEKRLVFLGIGANAIGAKGIGCLAEYRGSGNLLGLDMHPQDFYTADIQNAIRVLLKCAGLVYLDLGSALLRATCDEVADVFLSGGAMRIGRIQAHPKTVRCVMLSNGMNEACRAYLSGVVAEERALEPSSRHIVFDSSSYRSG